ncbi:MAG: NUDIX hydrolase [Clostridiales Family XIII bacterium]|jgi:ADP-ribose pyrophosphatase|nr:NUDIX hydrolase [Clostridiales Family XIII bacterium]
MIVEENTISTERIYEGVIINLRRDEVTVKDGRTSYREIVEHNGGVAVAALTSDGRMPMVRQFRKSAEAAMLEVPAGKTEQGETDLCAVAARELKEETGYTAGRLEYLMAFYTSIGYSTEKLHLYLATDLTPGETDFDENEAIDNYAYSPDELLEMIANGEIQDAKTIIAIQAVKLRQLAGTLQPRP